MAAAVQPTSGWAAKAAVEKARRDQEEQRSLWPKILWAARALSSEVTDNHLSERIRLALEGRQ